MLRARLPLLAASLILALVFAFAVASASRAVGRPTAFLLLDPFGAYSTVTLPGWASPAIPLHFPDRIVAVDDSPVGPAATYRDLPALRARALIEQRIQSGHDTATLRFDRNGTRFVLRAPVGRVTQGQFIPIVVVYLAMALCMAAAGIVVFFLAYHRPGGRAYVFLSVVGFLFLATFLDYHTEAWLTPIFLLAYGGNVLGIFWLAWSFPRPPRASLNAERAARAGALAIIAITLHAALAPVFGLSNLAARVALSLGIATSLLTLAVTTVLRWRTAVGRDREMLRSALGGLAIVPAIIGTGMALTLLASPRLMQGFIPLGGFFIPMSIGYALIRHNVFDTREILTRRLIALPVFLLAVTFGAMAWVVLDALPPAAQRVLLPALVFVLLVAGALALLRSAANRYVFQSSSLFQPTLESLSDRFARLKDPLHVLDAIEGMARQCLSVADAAVVQPDTLTDLPAASVGDLHRGERVWQGDTHEELQMLVPMRSLGELRAVLLVRPRTSGGILSSEDLSLLGTIASLGAVALHHAQVIDELQSLRRMELDVSRQDKRSTVGSLAAELAHEMVTPLNFLRSVLRSGRVDRPLDPETLDDAQEQVERLERLAETFRRGRSALPKRVATDLREVTRRTTAILRGALTDMGVDCQLDVPEGLSLLTDPDAFLQVLSNLLRNGAQAAGAGGSVGLRAERTPDGALRIDLWDTGPGVPDEILDRLFKPFVTTRKSGTGLGLFVCARVINSLGWEIHYLRETRTTFRIVVPREDVVRAEAPADAA